MRSLTRAIAHIDADCFFASVELLSRPDLKGKPVLVCNRTDNRGIVLTATYEARPFGIHAGTPVFKAKKLCPQAVIIPSHFEKYQLASYQLMQILKSFSPDVETCSIDEAFVDLTGLRLLYRTDYAGISRMIQKKVVEKIGITVSIGIASSKLLAKIASDFKKPVGLTLVSQKELKKFLTQISVGKITGVGHNTEALFNKFGMKTAYDVASSPLVPKLLGKRGKELQTELNGIALSKVEMRETLPKSLSNTRTFLNFSMDQKYIFSFSLKLLLHLSRRLREYGLVTGVIAFFLMTKDFQPIGLKKKMPHPTDDDALLIDIFKEIFEGTFDRTRIYRKSGFFFSNLTEKGAKQFSLFEIPRENDLAPTLDAIYKKFGPQSITRGSLL